MRIVTIHQPEHLPYLGFFHKVSMCDTLVLLDNVRFEKNYFQNRNRVNTAAGEKYITVPVTDTHGPINKVRICLGYFSHQCKKNAKTIIQAYRKTPFFEVYGYEFLNVYQGNKPERFSLSAYNEDLLRYLFVTLGINVNVVRASELGVTGSKTDLLVDICRKVGADKYVSGVSGKEYLELDKFEIPVEFQDFRHPVYTQYGKEEFTKNMSVIDSLFNVGPEIMSLIKAVNNGKKK